MSSIWVSAMALFQIKCAAFPAQTHFLWLVHDYLMMYSVIYMIKICQLLFLNVPFPFVDMNVQGLVLACCNYQVEHEKSLFWSISTTFPKRFKCVSLYKTFPGQAQFLNSITFSVQLLTSWGSYGLILSEEPANLTAGEGDRLSRQSGRVDITAHQNIHLLLSLHLRLL